MNRLLCALPEARCLSWFPVHPGVLADDVTREIWIQQAIGTSMVMAFLDSRELVEPAVLQSQVFDKPA